MPELPEVETVARQLAPALNGRSVKGLRILDPLLRRERTPVVSGRKIRDVFRLGKQVVVEFSGTRRNAAPLWLAVHLRMTGRLLWLPDGKGEGRKHLRARFGLDRGALHFYDTRRFGTFKWRKRLDDLQPEGCEPLGPEFTPGRLVEMLEGGKQNIKCWLLRQDRIVGLGNIYASEILHDAGVSPLRAAGSLSPAEAHSVHRATRKILKRAIRACGTTFSDFQDAYGVTGSYQAYLNVYERGDQPCKRCKSSIRRIVQQQRSTYYCAACQD